MALKIINLNQIGKYLKRPHFTEDDFIKEIEILGGYGLLISDLQAYFGVKKAVWYRICDKNKQIVEALLRGKVKTGIMVVSKLMQNIEAGHPASIMFYLKCQCNWKETRLLDVTPETKRLLIPTDLKKFDVHEASKIYQEVMSDE